MKRNLIITSLFASAVALMFISGTTDTTSPCDSPVVGDHSGAPGETNCTYCHAGTINTGPGSLVFHVGNDSTYVPGQTYNCSVFMSQGTLSKFGFVDLALKNSNNTTIGTFNIIDSVRTRKYTLGGRNYFSHTPCGADAATLGQNSWNYTWTAPATNVGAITLYISGLAANHNEATTGDYTYTTSIILNPSSAAGISEADADKISVYPNPASDKIIIAGLENEKVKSLSVTDVTGKILIHKPNISDGKNFTINLNESSFMQVGIYFLRIETDKGMI